MTNEQAEALGRRWIAAGGGWRAGMLTDCNERVLRADAEYLWVGFDYESETGRWDVDTERVRADDRGARWPDFRDAATRGAALGVVRERWGEPALQVSPRMHFERSVMDKGVLAGWAYYVNDLDEHSGRAPSEAEALVAALEAAPKERG